MPRDRGAGGGIVFFRFRSRLVGCSMSRGGAARPRPPSRIIVFARWMSSCGGTLGIVVKFESPEKSFDSAEIDTDVGLGWNGTSGGSKRSEEHTSELQSRLHLVC